MYIHLIQEFHHFHSFPSHISANVPPILQFSKMCLQDNLADCADCGGLCPGLARFGKLVGLVEQSKHLIFMLYLSKIEMKEEKTLHTKIVILVDKNGYACSNILL